MISEEIEESVKGKMKYLILTISNKLTAANVGGYMKQRIIIITMTFDFNR